MQTLKAPKTVAFCLIYKHIYLSIYRCGFSGFYDKSQNIIEKENLLFNIRENRFLQNAV